MPLTQGVHHAGMATSSHVVISGAGRAGTSFLMALLTRLGLDTGFSADQVTRELARPARAGLEWDLRGRDLPRVVKNPNLCDHIDSVLARRDLRIEHLIVPLREPVEAARSRRRAQQDGLAALPWHKRWRAVLRGKAIDGGLWPGTTAADQEQVVVDRVHRLLLAVAARDIPVTLLAYPRLTRDPAYLFAKLKPVLGGVDWPRFHAAFAAQVRPDWVHVAADESLGHAPSILMPEGT